MMDRVIAVAVGVGITALFLGCMLDVVAGSNRHAARLSEWLTLGGLFLAVSGLIGLLWMMLLLV